jgi:hypothetical protein
MSEQLFYRIESTDFVRKILKEYRNCLAKDCITEKIVIQSDALYKPFVLTNHISKQVENFIIIPDAILQQIPFFTLVNTSKKKKMNYRIKILNIHY